MPTTLTGRNSIDTNFNGISALTVRATSTRLGSRGWRLSDTSHGRAIRRTRNGKVTSNKRVERILPTLSDEEQERLARELSLAEREREFRATLPSVHIDAND